MKSRNNVIKKSALSSAILCALGSAQSATILVENSCTLADAIVAANTDSVVGSCTTGLGADVIQVVTPDSNINITTIFEPSGAVGSVGLPIINSEVTIEGNGLRITRGPYGDNLRILEVASGGDLTLRDTTVSGGDDGYGQGSGLLAYYGQVTLENTTFANNNGGVMLVGSIGSSINNSVIRHNFSDNYSFGVGLTAIISTLEVNESSFIENKAISNAPLRGGGGGPFIAGGASLFQSEVTIRNSTFSGNNTFYGGAMSITSDNPPSLPSKLTRLDNSPLRGMIDNNVTITNSTITNNESYLASGILELSNYGTLTLQGNIIAGNQEFVGDFAANIYSEGDITAVLDGNNIIGDNGNTGVYGVTLGASDSTFSNYAKDNLYPLSLSNGQLTHPLKEGSAAIDGNDLSCFGAVVDQDGKARGIDGDDNGSFFCDVGAFEHSLAINADGSPCTFENAISSANSDSSVGGCQPGNGHDIINLPADSTQTSTNIQYTNSFGYYFGFSAITSAITIEGNNSTITKDIAAVDSFDIFHVGLGAQLNLINTTVTGADGNIGAITGAGYGNFRGGNTNILDSKIINNASRGLFDWQSINSSVVNSTISQNAPSYTGGLSDALAAGMSTVASFGFELKQSTISNNTGFVAGGVDFRSVNGGTIENSTISGNFANNYGGVIVVPYIFNNQNQIINSTITGNEGSVSGGGVIFGNQFVSTTMTQSVVSGNILTPPAPGVERVYTLGLETISGGGPDPIEIYGNDYLILDGLNIIGQNGNSGTYGATLGGSDLVPMGATDTVIETSLADNGGDTLTHLPVLGGLAVDAGTDFCATKVDQLGRIRPWDGNSDGDDACDVGAVELGSVTSSDLIFKDGFDATIFIKREILKK